VTVRPIETVTRAARLMEAARVKRVPVVDAGGHLVGIVSRRDLVRLYTRPDADIRAAVADSMLRSLWIDPALLGIQVHDGIVTVSGHLDRRSTAAIVVAFTHAVPGVVDVERDEIACNVRVAQVTGFGHTPALSVDRRSWRRSSAGPDRSRVSAQ
jgi:CBS domain-containing protein